MLNFLPPPPQRAFCTLELNVDIFGWPLTRCLKTFNHEFYEIKLHFQKWRDFCECFKGKVEDYNIGCLLRLDCTEDIKDKNTTQVQHHINSKQWKISFIFVYQGHDLK